MSDSKYRGIFPAFYACYDDVGGISPARTQALARHLLAQGVQGLYVNGSSGECIYLDVQERMTVLENVMEAVGGKMTVIAHVACNNTRDSQALARHAEKLGVDAIARYWNDISEAAPQTDFIIYNIPQLAGVSLTPALLTEMLNNQRVAGVKNSSMAALDIQVFKDLGGSRLSVFNGPDEQLAAGLMMGACGGIGGTYGAMPRLYLKLYDLVLDGQTKQAIALQNDICRVIAALVSGRGNMYAMIKELLRCKGLSCGGVRAPLAPLNKDDLKQADLCEKMIQQAERAYLG